MKLYNKSKGGKIMKKIIYNKIEGISQGASLPFVISFNGKVGEADSLRELISFLIPEYIDAEDIHDEYLLRIKYARKEAMAALKNDIDVVLYDSKKGVLSNNYAAAIDDDDYEMTDEEEIKIYIDTEKDFLLSLAELGVIRVLFRDDVDRAKCIECAHREESLCTLYKNNIKELSGSCESGIKNKSETHGFEYMEMKRG